MKTYGIRKWLYPFTFVYGFGVWVRNTLFDLDLIHSSIYDVPVICVGNLTVGGTGKTPMTEYLVRLLSSHHRVAVLSRGYKRNSKGFVRADASSVARMLGDEPTQIARKFPDAVVAVDENRRRGIELLSQKGAEPPIDVIVLDDAYQHRYVTPGMTILLIDYNRPIHNDCLLPAGNLREPASHHKRADIILFTKCPPDITPIERRIIRLETNPYPDQSVFFTTMEYGPLYPVGPMNNDKGSPLTMESILEQSLPVLAIVGIASPAPFIQFVKQYCPTAQTMEFSDHHRFSDKEIARIQKSFETIRAANGCIITTEKDSVRMADDPRFEPLLPFCYYPTFGIRFLDQAGDQFDKKILNYVQNNKRNS